MGKYSTILSDEMRIYNFIYWMSHFFQKDRSSEKGDLTSVIFKIVNASFLASFHFLLWCNLQWHPFFLPSTVINTKKLAFPALQTTLKLENCRKLVKQGFKMSWLSHFHKSLGSLCNARSLLQNSVSSSFTWCLLMKGKEYWHTKTIPKPLLL